MDARMRTGSGLAAALALLCLAGCAGGPVNEPTPTARPPFHSAPPWPSPSGTPVPASAVSAARRDAITADLRGRGVTATPTIVSAEQVEWSNGALGCPSPGQSYVQMVIEGMRVIVTVGGTTYDYRFGRSDTPVLCPSSH